jgi:hypothetical protein
MDRIKIAKQLVRLAKSIMADDIDAISRCRTRFENDLKDPSNYWNKKAIADGYAQTLTEEEIQKSLSAFDKLVEENGENMMSSNLNELLNRYVQIYGGKTPNQVDFILSDVLEDELGLN